MLITSHKNLVAEASSKKGNTRYISIWSASDFVLLLKGSIKVTVGVEWALSIFALNIMAGPNCYSNAMTISMNNQGRVEM